MTPAELRQAIDAYLDKGPDFLKFGGTSHFSSRRSSGSPPRRSSVIVDDAHARNRAAETHSTSVEGSPAVDRRRHRRHPASRAARRARDFPTTSSARIVDRGVELFDAGEHHHRPGVEAASQEQGRSRKEEGEAKDEAQKEEGKRRARKPEGRRQKTTAELRKEAVRARRGARVATRQRAEADPRRLPRHARNRQLLGGGTRVHADAETARAGSRHRHNPGDRGAGRAGHDAGAGDRRGHAQRRRWPRGPEGLRHARAGQDRRPRRAHGRSARRHPQPAQAVGGVQGRASCRSFAPAAVARPLGGAAGGASRHERFEHRPCEQRGVCSGRRPGSRSFWSRSRRITSVRRRRQRCALAGTTCAIWPPCRSSTRCSRRCCGAVPAPPCSCSAAVRAPAAASPS